MHRNWRRREAVENSRESAVANLVGDHIRQRHRDPIPHFRRGDGCSRVIDLEPRDKGNAVAFFAVEKAPLPVGMRPVNAITEWSRRSAGVCGTPRRVR
jgi:hypothetical protein